VKAFSDAKRLLVLLQRRTAVLRGQAQRHREELARVDEEIAGKRRDVEQLIEELSHSAIGRQYGRSELMRARGQQAVMRFEIACRRMEEADLIERRDQIEDELDASRKAALALEQRQNKHRDWLARERLKHDLLRELLADAEIAEIMEGKAHGFNQH
jgi:hypothetical protein